MIHELEIFRAWLSANSDWLVPLGAVAAVLVIVWAVLVSFGNKIYFWFEWVRQKLANKPGTPDTRITFVLNPRRTLWNMGKRGTEPAMQIITSWYVTNASNVPIRILEAGLITPNSRGRTCTALVHIVERETNWARGGMDVEIAPGQTEIMEATFFLDPPTEKENRPLKVEMYVVDQYGRKHKAPKIKLRYRFPSAETY